MIDESSNFIDQSVEFSRNITERRSGSQGAGGKTKRYKEKIANLEGKLELLQLENLSLQNDIKKRGNGLLMRHQNSVMD